MSLAGKVKRALAWSAADGAIRAGLNLAFTITLARLVSPEEFGVVAMVLVFTAISGVISNFGTTSALIQLRDTSFEDESTAFHFTILSTSAVACALALSAPLIADFLRQPLLAGIVPVLSLNLVVSAFGSVQSALLRKRLHFRPSAWISLVSMTVGGAVAIYLANEGYGAWSLAWQSVVGHAVQSALLWTVSDWRPALRFSWMSLRRLLAFGGYMTLASTINAAYVHFFALLIGRIFGPVDAGQYARAHSTQQFSASFLTNVVNRVAFPAFAAASGDPARLRNGLGSAIRTLMLVNAPLSVGMALVAEPLVVTAFGEPWRASAPILQILCLAGALWPMQVLNINALMSQGHSKLVLRLEIIKKSLGLSVLLTASQGGLLAIALGQLGVSLVAFFINAHYTRILLGLGALAQLRLVWRTGVSVAGMAAAVQVVLALGPDGRVASLATSAMVGAATFLLLARLTGELSDARLGTLLGHANA